MAKALVGTLALALLPTALTFQNTSPFFLFSSIDLQINEFDPEISNAKELFGHAKDILKYCRSRSYFVVLQDAVASTDFLDRRSTPVLASYMDGKNPNIKTSLAVPEVVGLFDTDLLSSYIQHNCGAEVISIDATYGKELPAYEPRPIDSPPLLVHIKLPNPKTKLPGSGLNAQDHLLGDAIERFAPSSHFTVVYATTPPNGKQVQTGHNEHTYEMEDVFGDAVHMELKRDTSFHRRETVHRGGLFEKYQYFSPGIFMGISATIPLVLILIVGLRALSSLEVSYFAFSKEMGPAGQRRQG